MDDQHTGYAVLGEALLQELLVRAGLTHARMPRGGEPLEVSLDFRISADRNHALVISSDRIGNTPLELRIDLE